MFYHLILFLFLYFYSLILIPPLYVLIIPFNYVRIILKLWEIMGKKKPLFFKGFIYTYYEDLFLFYLHFSLVLLALILHRF